jgi:cobaltochelatase CobS
MQRIEIDAGIFNIPNSAGKMLPGYDTATDHPFRPALLPTYQFRTNDFRLINWWWVRENHRADYATRVGLLLMGPKSTGKSTLPEQYLTRLGVPVVSYTANRRTQIDDLVGSKTVVGGDVYRVDGPLVLAMKGGFPFILNELDLMDPGELTGLNDIVERGQLVFDDGTVLRAERGFGFIATMNTRGAGDVEGNYAGTQVMNKALMSRFVKMALDYPAIEEETSIICASFPSLNRAEAEIFARTAAQIRAAYVGGAAGVTAIEDTIGTREVLMWIEVASAFRQVRADAVAFALETVLTAATEGVTKRVITEIVQRNFNQ